MHLPIVKVVVGRALCVGQWLWWCAERLLGWMTLLPALPVLGKRGRGTVSVCVWEKADTI